MNEDINGFEKAKSHVSLLFFDGVHGIEPSSIYFNTVSCSNTRVPLTESVSLQWYVLQIFRKD